MHHTKNWNSWAKSYLPIKMPSILKQRQSGDSSSVKKYFIAISCLVPRSSSRGGNSLSPERLMLGTTIVRLRPKNLKDFFSVAEVGRSGSLAMVAVQSSPALPKISMKKGWGKDL